MFRTWSSAVFGGGCMKSVYMFSPGDTAAMVETVSLSGVHLLLNTIRIKDYSSEISDGPYWS